MMRGQPMWVRELHNKNLAGLSRRKNGKHIYGILYEIIEPITEEGKDDSPTLNQK